MILLAALIVFAAIFCLVLGLSAQRENPMSARIAGLRGERTVGDFRAPQTESFGSRIFAPLADSLGTRVEGLLPARWLEGLDNRIIQAGAPISRTGFLTAIVFVEAFVVLFSVVMVTSAGGLSGMMLYG